MFKRKLLTKNLFRKLFLKSFKKYFKLKDILYNNKVKTHMKSYVDRLNLSLINQNILVKNQNKTNQKKSENFKNKMSFFNNPLWNQKNLFKKKEIK